MCARVSMTILFKCVPKSQFYLYTVLLTPFCFESHGPLGGVVI